MNEKQRRKQAIKEAEERAGAGLASVSQLAQVAGRSTEATRTGTEELLEIAERVARKGQHFKAGHIFEAMLALRERQDAVQLGAHVEIVMTHLDGRHTDPADIEWRSGGKVAGAAQAKFSVQDDAKIADMICDPKYRGQTRLIPADRIAGVREELRSRIACASSPAEKALCEDAHRNLREHEITTRDVVRAMKSPKGTYWRENAAAVGREALANSAISAGTAGIVGGSVSICRHGSAWLDGTMSGEDFATAVAKDAGTAAGRGAVVAAGGVVLNRGALMAGIKFFGKSNPATAYAAALLDTGLAVWDFARGRIDSAEMMLRMGETGLTLASALFYGAAGGAFFGPLGAVVGGTAGVLAAMLVRSSVMTILREAKLAKEEADRIERLSEESCAFLRLRRKEFEKELRRALARCREQTDALFGLFDSALESDNPDKCIQAVQGFAGMFGRSLRFASQIEFDGFMADSGKPLIL